MFVMWSHTLRSARQHAFQRPHRPLLAAPSRRSYNGPHTTYFSPPPPPPRQPSRVWRFVRAVVYASAGVYLGIWFEAGMNNILWDLTSAAMDARAVPALDLDHIRDILKSRSGLFRSHNAITQAAQLPSNLPCEDVQIMGSYEHKGDPKTRWSYWAIFDGHAGPQTATILARMLPHKVGINLNMHQSYAPNDVHVRNIIRKTFLEVDQSIVGMPAKDFDSSVPLATKVHLASMASAGSCALFALFDPSNSVLRVANVGDSRAVLGRWDDESHQYVAKPLSVDHTGFNPDEVARIEREHPDEKVIDPRTGRVHGIAVSRAFGDARWKWSEDATKKIHDMAWGPSPRPNNAIKTPPYLTAEPEITETQIRKGKNADFLIMASDGLWDNMSSDDAVAAVQMWLQKYKPTDATRMNSVESFASLKRRAEHNEHTLRQWEPLAQQSDAWHPQSEPEQSELLAKRSSDLHLPSVGDRVGTTDDDTFHDKDGSLRWRVSPKHFTVEDEHCGAHLIRNALGGSRRDLLQGVMSIQPPLSRNVRDDITVLVIFFGDDYRAQQKK